MTRSYVLATISLNNMAGGLERNIVRLANHLVSKGDQVALITFDRRDAKAFFQIDGRATWHKVGTSEPHRPISVANRFRLIRNIRDVLKSQRPDAVVCFHHGILPRFFAAGIFLGMKYVASERNSLRIYDHVRLRKWNPGFLLMSLVVRITVQFKVYVNDYPAWFRQKITVIPNPVEQTDFRAEPDRPGKDGMFTIISLGRLSTQKNYEAMISAFAEATRDLAEWRLVIFGDGDRRDALLRLAGLRGVGERVEILPACPSVMPHLAAASAYCVSSQWEGFPNALAEAMSVGLPAVGYRGCAGVCDLIDHNETGLLADGNGGIGTLAEAMRQLMSDPGNRRRLGDNARARISQYQPERVLARWDHMLERI